MSACTPVPLEGTSDERIRSFLTILRSQGYSDSRLQGKRRVLVAFARWAEQVAPEAQIWDESLVTAFHARRQRRSQAQRAVERATLRQFVAHVAAARSPSRVTAPASCSIAELRYAEHLRAQRGLAERSIAVYGSFARQFVAAMAPEPGEFLSGGLDVAVVRRFFLDRVANRSTAYAKLLAAALRSFLRFLFAEGQTPHDISAAVAPVSGCARPSYHAFFSPEEVERIVASADPETGSGRRDRAILLLLARLGLRAGEVVALRLDDLRWRTGEIVVRGKGGTQARLPLPEDVGEALAAYVQHDRGQSRPRPVFLRLIAPREGLTGPAAVGHVVRAAMARAGVKRPGRGAAHLLRHSLATRMIRHGASLPEIAEILRHRSLDTTSIYAEVAFESLRAVARPWPAESGGKR